MLQVIEYTNGLIGLTRLNLYGSMTLKIQNVEFKLNSNDIVSLTEMPTEILEPKTIPAQIIRYQDRSNENVTLSVDEYKLLASKLHAFGSHDDDDNFIWETREDKQRYDDFVATWKPIYSESTIEWVPVEFEVVVKEYVPEEYAEFIVSSIIVGQDGNKSKYKSICRYTSNKAKMLRMVAEKLGFEIVTNEHLTSGKKVYIYTTNLDSVLRFSKVNDHYFRMEQDVHFGNCTGTLEECIVRYKREYNAIYSYLNSEKNVIENKDVNPEEREGLLQILEICISNYHKVDSMKLTRSYYQALGTQLKSLKSKLMLNE